MRKLKFFWIFLVLIAFAAVVAVAADEVPTPPYYGMWLLRDGKLHELPASYCTQVGNYRGVTQVVKKVAVELKENDRIFCFTQEPTGRLFATILGDLKETGGNPWAGGTYEVGLFLPETNGNGKIAELPLNMRPSKYISGVIMQEIILDLSKAWSSVIVLHGGVLTSGYIPPSNSPIFPLLYNNRDVRDWSDLFE